MKKFCSIILATAVAASLFAGCNQNKLTDTTTASTIATESSAAASGGETVQTTAPAETEVWEPESFEELYGDQLMNYLGHQYYFDGKAIPVEESNFYFINAFFDLSGYANMGYYPATTIGYIDLAAEYTGADYETYGDFFVKYAENSLFTSMILNARAEAKGMKLSNETLESIDAMMEDLRTGKAANSGMNLDEYLQFYYGPGNDEVHFRSVLERYYLADAYSAIYCDEYEFEDSVKYVPYVRYALFYAPDTAEQAEKDKALEQANKMKDSCTKIDDLSDLAATAQEQGLVADQGDIEVPKGQMVAKFEEWAYGANRKEGELDVIYAPEYGYFVVGYLGLKERDKDTLDQIALNDLSASLKDEIANGGHDFHTDEAYGPAPAAPTPTTAPDVTPAEDSGTVTTDPTSASVPADQTTPVNKQLSTTDVLVVVFITLAAVAIAAVVIILIASAMKNGKNGGSKTSSAKSSSTPKSSAPKKESKPKASSKKVEDEDDDEDDEDDEEEEDEDDEDDDE